MFRQRGGRFCCCFLAAFWLVLAGTALDADQNVRIIGNDRGGYIGARAREIAAMNASETRVELRGRICLSACTMYLGVGNICVDPRTTFGFHGPSRHGTALGQDEFHHWSRVMANHYNPPLRTWFWETARHRIAGYYRMTGSQLIRLGYPACPTY